MREVTNLTITPQHFFSTFGVFRYFRVISDQILMRYFRILLVVFALMPVMAAGAEVTDSLMTVLRQTIANRGAYSAHKEDRLVRLRKEISSDADDIRRFHALDALLNEYQAYNTDSAFAVCERRERLARRIGDPYLIRNAALNTANVLASTGMYKEAFDIMDTIPSYSIPEYMRPFRYHILRTVYGLMDDYAVRREDHERYGALTRQYLDSLMAVNAPGTLGYVMAQATRDNADGRSGAAVRAVRDYLADNETTAHEKAICAFTLSESFERLGDRSSQKEQLLRAAIADLQSAVREYASLRKLAVLLYEDGEVELAYELLRITLEDADKCNARLRVVEANSIFPIVNGMYIDTIREQRSRLKAAVYLISLLAVGLLFAVFYVMRQMRRTAAARKEAELSGNRLKQLNAELNASNAELYEANRTIAENSCIKEEYIARYMDQCSLYIEKIDSYRKQLGKLIAAGKIEQLGNTIRSTAFLDEELKNFYADFDNTFLSLFPTFVNDFNALLRPDEAIVPKKAGQLTTELRIFALIRLGISDSVKIAQFLRYSVTTIYNYRTKARNKAAGDRDKLEEEVMKIGRETGPAPR